MGAGDRRRDGRIQRAPDFGHDYSVDFVGAWATVTTPDGWTSADTLALQDFLHVDD